MTKNHIKNSGKPYTKEEIAQLKALAKVKTPMKELCLALGRSGGSIKNIAEKKGINLINLK